MRQRGGNHSRRSSSRSSRPKIRSVCCSARTRATSCADASLIEQELPPEVPAGLPSALLERRPDIRAAEQTLIAANAQHRRRQGGVFPAVEPERISGRPEHATVEPVHRPAQRLELRAAGHAADLHRRPPEIQRASSRKPNATARWSNMKRPFRPRSPKSRTR